MSKVVTDPLVDVRNPDTYAKSSERFIAMGVGESFARMHYNTGRGIRTLGKDPFTPEGYAALGEWQRKRFDAIPEGDERNAAIRKTHSHGDNVSVFVRALQMCYAEHIPLALRPETLWSIVTGEVAQYVKDNAKDPAISAVFGVEDPNAPKRHIEVYVNEFVYGSPDNNWLRGIEKFREKLEAITPSGLISAMCPELSTETATTRIALLVTAMDAASPYTTYGMTTLCGIPAIRIDGTEHDWRRIAHHAREMGRMFPGLSLYAETVSGIFTKIADTVRDDGVSEELLSWWREIYKLNGGSGGPYLSGWFNGLYAHRYGGKGAKLKDTFEVPGGFGAPKTSNFPLNLSRVEFVWTYHGQKIPMMFVSGIGEAEFDNGYITPRLTVAVAELSKGS